MTNNSGTGWAMVTKFGQNMRNRQILKVEKYQVPSICLFEAKKKFPVGGVDLPPPPPPPCRIGLTDEYYGALVSPYSIVFL